jgi:transcriptional regulator with PAS, ATPase and Fis domain
MSDFHKIRNILIKFRNKDITQDVAEDQLLELIKTPTTVGEAFQIDYSKLNINYDELAKSIMKIDPFYVYIPPVKEETSLKSIIIEDGDGPISLEMKEIDMIKKALARHKGKRKYAATELGISERTLYRKINEYSLEC